jgi:imidazolonepropionase-like amidohydrolase
MRQKMLILLLGLCFITVHSRAQDYTIVIKGGHVIDAKNKINEVMDVAIKGDKIALVAKNIDPKQAQVIDAKGFYVSPGLIDIHSHNFFGTQEDHYLGDGFEALPPDGFTFRSGVTTVVDCGGAGWKTFTTFRDQTINHSKTRVLSFLNIVGEGMRGGAYEQNLNDILRRQTTLESRAAVLNAMSGDYIRTARAKGASVMAHAFKEGLLIPVTEIVAAKIPFILGGAVIVEQVFNWPGMGRMAWQAAQDRDFPVIMGIAILAAVLVRMGSLFQSVVYVAVNPRASKE